MQKKNLIRFLESLILLPMVAGSFQGDVTVNSIKNMTPSPYPQIVLFQKENIENLNPFSFNQELDEDSKKLDLQGEAIDAYFRARNMPLVGFGRKMAEEANKNDIDWRLLPAIAVRESTGGKYACIKATYNSFGWGSCKINFKSNEEAIEVVAKNLGGNNPNTAHHYDDKTTKQILRAYNPPSVVPRYAEQVISIMNAIGNADLGEPKEGSEA